MATDPLSLRTGPVAATVRAARLIAVLRRVEPRERLVEFVDVLVDDGIRILEITLDGPAAAGDLAAIRARVGDRATVGAGTIRTRDELAAAIDAGAAFGVSPVLDPEILAAALEAGLPFLPGAYSPTEVDAAWRGGATFVKLFPGSSLGPVHVRELRGPLAEIETVVTGGVDGSNAGAFLEAGASAVGIGSALWRMDRTQRRALAGALGAIGETR